MSQTNGKPHRQRLEDRIEHNVLPVMYATAAGLGVLLLLALVVLAWKEVF